MASYKHCNQCRRIYLPSDYEIKNKPLETLKKIKIHGHFEMTFKFNSYCGITEHRHSGITIKEYSEEINYGKKILISNEIWKWSSN
ncbi:hypothetical protein SDAV_001227 [Spiroplasma phoeniceum P40]|uniref:Uncharacterized protein n=1 Tax=Spiroplasma phoeniceum P40 TaxID=1276259 RepID=A0A345DPQ6_9MOLU|nr:hypothetical protein SDAV_0081 [Spiroplasma phoeniceum P40]AXF96194.1 hypothetical protein SDAV_001227 [Spiroplasma phoeniceum P40]